MISRRYNFVLTDKLFCKGVPVSTIRLLVFILFMAMFIADLVFFKMCPSSPKN